MTVKELMCLLSKYDPELQVNHGLAALISEPVTIVRRSNFVRTGTPPGGVDVVHLGGEASEKSKWWKEQ